MTRKADIARSYRGLSQEERRDDRRRRLIAAALDVYGEVGYRKASVKAVCEAAGLTERYFYESFGSSEDLLVACYQTVSQRLLKEIVEAAQEAGPDRRLRAQAMMCAYFTALRSDPRCARVFLVESRGTHPSVEAVYQAALGALARDVLRVLDADATAANELLALGIIGGIGEVALHWALRGYEPAMEEVIAVGLQLAEPLLGRTVARA